MTSKEANHYNEQKEVRVVDPNTGGEKGQKIERFSLIPFEFLVALARHYGVGSKKYADRNWEKGYKWSLSYDAFQRHLNQWLLGERHDAETGGHHLIAAIWHLIALYIFDMYHKGTDDITKLNNQFVPLLFDKEAAKNSVYAPKWSYSVDGVLNPNKGYGHEI